MSFTDIYFLFAFLPAFLLVFYLTPSKYRRYIILLGGLVFYWIGVSSRPLLMLLPLGEIVIIYLAARLLGCYSDLKKLIVIICSVILFGILLAFKYLGLFTGLSIVIPAGLSFYTFQLSAYLYDVSRGKVSAEKNILTFSAVMLYFPKLLSGPITPWESISPQLSRPRPKASDLDAGLRTFLTGLGLKMLVANRVGGLWTQANNVGISDITSAFAWLAALSFSLQLYFDFYGYSLMAIGLGRMMGIRLPDNFRHPYESRSMTDFWRRWHITLGAWFRDYLYIPLGGNRVSTMRSYINLFIVWVATGIWHGSTLNYILWGIFLFVVIAAERLLKIEKNRSILSYLYMIPVTLLSWSIFASKSMKQLGGLFSSLFRFLTKNPAVLRNDWWFYGKKYLLIMVVAVILALPLPARIWSRLKRSPIGTVILLIVFILSVYAISGGLNDPFMYFSF